MPTSLEWQGHPEGARANEIGTLLGEQLGHSAFERHDDVELVVSVTTEQRPCGRYPASIELSTPEPERVGGREIESDWR